MDGKKLAAVFYSDIHRFQKILNENEKAARDLARRHKTLLNAVVKKHTGTLSLVAGKKYAPKNVRIPDPLGDFSKSAEGKRAQSCKKLPKIPRKQTEPLTRVVL